eukprot:Transcript_22385.p2 GENE.Transcript_22385~~Transcript_22385.p2  ORF type:complete len:431 (-),score=160.25 Transcript_22385:290-1582(-)
MSADAPRLPKEKVSAPPRGPARSASGSTFCGGTMWPNVCVPSRPAGSARKSCCSRSRKGCIVPPASTTACASASTLAKCTAGLRCITRKKLSGAQAGAAVAERAPESFLRVMHLNPAVHFAKVLAEAHAVVLAGGTMQPFRDLEQQLFRALPAGRLGTHTFGHIVPPQNVLPLALRAGPRGGALTFSFGNRGASALIDELGEALLAVARRVPDGVVVFVPSFQYEAQLVARWKASGLWERLDRVKPLFREPRASSDLDALLKSYAAAIHGEGEAGEASGGGGGGDDGRGDGGDGAARGALLLSVVGGKMSEGINFSDALARCVVMVGMPYANPSDLTLQERMAYIEQAQGAGAGREYYTNLCMKAVNQSIGRAIRHRRDYSAMLLLDGRYAKAEVRGRLPKWIGARLQAAPNFDAALEALDQFFAAPRAS